MQIDYILLANLVGWLSVALHIVAFAANTPRKMLGYNLASTSLLGASMIPFGGYAGAAMCVFSIISKTAGISGKIQINEAAKALLAITVGIAYLTLFSEEGIIGMFPSISLIFIVMADLQTDIIKMKMWYYGSAFCWLAYAISLMSIPAIAYDIIGILILTTAILKLKKEEKQC